MSNLPRLLAGLLWLAAPLTATAQDASAAPSPDAPTVAASPEPPTRVVELEPQPGRRRGLRLEPAEPDPWEGWTARERNNFAWAWFPFVFFGLQGFVGGVGGAFAIATDPARSADPRAWAPVALVPAAGPWIRLLDPGIDDYAAPVAMAVASTLGLTALIAGIALLVELVDRGSRANRRRSSY